MEIRSECLGPSCKGQVLFTQAMAPEADGLAGLCLSCGALHHLAGGVKTLGLDLRRSEPVGGPGASSLAGSATA